ncbi:hypothetical protein Ciccas_005164 [Cichlidogyrus casuarinus]|uniref:Exophilin 5 n=1 Tax=Cichlidogyrus casuarinus TaxID=1844966 RepID=A0ABD2QD01_9PLAT
MQEIQNARLEFFSSVIFNDFKKQKGREPVNKWLHLDSTSRLPHNSHAEITTNVVEQDSVASPNNLISTSKDTVELPFDRKQVLSEISDELRERFHKNEKFRSPSFPNLSRRCSPTGCSDQDSDYDYLSLKTDKNMQQQHHRYFQNRKKTSDNPMTQRGSIIKRAKSTTNLYGEASKSYTLPSFKNLRQLWEELSRGSIKQKFIPKTFCSFTQKSNENVILSKFSTSHNLKPSQSASKEEFLLRGRKIPDTVYMND